jgi:hypothetical protein
MKRKKIIIPAPIANFGDTVLVYNYRHDHGWEEGIVSGLEYKNCFGGRFSWTYSVRTVRVSSSGRGVVLYVGDDKIRRI